MTVALVDTAGVRVPEDGRPITLRLLTSGQATTLQGTLTALTSKGVASFGDLVFLGPATGLSLEASSPGLTPVQSAPFGVADGPAVTVENLLRNGGFESGILHWGYYQDGGPGNAFTMSTAPPVPFGAWKARIDLGPAIGTNNQIYQLGFALEPNTAYRLQYYACASQPTPIRVRVIEQNDDYSVYGFPFVRHSLTETWQPFVVEFVTASLPAAVPDAMVQFYFVGSMPSTRVWFDSVSIVRMISGQQAASRLSFGVQPSSTTPGATITPALTVRIEDASGNLVTGDTRSVAVALGGNPGSGTLSGTQTVSAVGGVATFSTLSLNNVGNGYTLTASATGLTGATSSAFNITTAPPPPTGNIVVNGGFEGGTWPWRHYQNGGGTNSFSVVTEAPVAEGTRKGKVVLDASIGTNNQVWQQGLSLDAATAYRLQFLAYAVASTTIRVRVLEQDDDYTIYGFNFRTISLSTGWQTFTVDFTTANFAGTVTDAMVQFYFVGSTPSNTLYFDDVQITRQEGTPPPGAATKLSFGVQPSSTTPGATITPALTVRIEDASGNLVTGDTRSVAVALGGNPGSSTLSGTQTVSAVGGVATFSTLSLNNVGNGYTLTASATGLTGATSSAFNITTAPPPPTGNIVVNGGFEGGTWPWRHYQNGGGTNSFSVVTEAPVAEGTRKGKVVLDASIGTNNQVWQQGLTLQAGAQYRLRYAGSASQNTTIRVRIIEQDDDYTVYGFPFVKHSLTTGWQTFTVDFTTANFTGTVTDAMVQFYFIGSTPSTTISLDDVILEQTSIRPKPGLTGGDPNGEGTTATGEGANDVHSSTGARFQNYPNPFNASTQIAYVVPVFSHIRLEVFNILGERVTTLVDTDQPAGTYSVRLNAEALPSGVYHCRLISGGDVKILSILLAK